MKAANLSGMTLEQIEAGILDGTVSAEQVDEILGFDTCHGCERLFPVSAMDPDENGQAFCVECSPAHVVAAA